jgi:hypothetical protein
MDSRELAEWMAMDTLEPIGPHRDAFLWMTIRNAWRGKNDPAASLEDYPFMYQPRPEQTVDEMRAVLNSIFPK